MLQFQFPNCGGVLMSKYPMMRWLKKKKKPLKPKAASLETVKTSSDFFSLATGPNNPFPAP